MPFALPVLLAFLLLMAAVGAWHARRIRSAEDFVLGGRRLKASVLTGTLVATWIGTGSLFGNAEFAYERGVAAFFLPLAGLVGMLVLAWLAPRVRGISATSVPQIVGQPFGAAARLLGAVALVCAYLVIVSYQYRAGAAVAQRLFPDLSPSLLVFSFALFVILYTAAAGMVSVAWTDVLNGIVMALGLLVALFFLVGDWRLRAEPLAPELLHWDGGLGAMGWINVMLPPFLLMLGDANLYQRFLAAGSPRAARRSAQGAFLGLLVLEGAIVALAILGRALLPQELAQPGHVIVELAFSILPTAVGVLLAAAAVATIISTADSYLLACSTTVAMDMGKGLTGPGRQRVLVICLGFLALWMSTWSDRFLSVALYAYTLYGASLTPAVLCALLRPSTRPRAVVGGMVAGLGTALLWKLGLEMQWFPGFWAGWDPVLPALCANLLALFLLERA